jgi:two-component system, OmpR family, sensor histidine kinase KdpD
VRPYLAAMFLVATTTVVGLAVRVTYPVPDVEVLFLLAVVIAAIRFGRGPSLTAAFLGVGCYDFFFVPPYLTFDVSDARYLLTFAMLFAVSFLVSEVTTRLRRQERNALAREQQARIAELRSALLSSVSHDLRTPLAAITGAATSLRDDPKLSEQTRAELLESICDEAERLERLVSNLLEMTRLESGAVVLRRDWVPIDEIIGSALTRLEARLAGRPVRVELSSGLPMVSVDPVLIEQVFLNLLDNSIKHTPPGSPLEISGFLLDQAVAVDVIDRGPGLTAGSEERVFEMFYRGPTSGVAGAGLGLPICRGIMQAHGGGVSALNGAGGGARFRVVFPRGAEPPRMPAETGGAA